MDAGNTFTYTLVAGAGDSDNGVFNIDGSNLRATNSFDFETKSSYMIRVRSTDQGGLFTEKTFTISVTNVNEAPTDIALSSTSIVENAGANAVVGALSTTDVDAGNTFTYTLVAGTGDADNGAFNIDGSNLRATSSFDFETKSSYTIRIGSTDQGGLFTEKTFTISVLDINDAPVAGNDSYWVSMDTPESLPVLENDTDVDNLLDAETIQVIDGPQNGTAKRTADGRLEYIPRLGFRGVDSFTYHVRDKLGLVSNVATVNLRINSAPIAKPDAFLVKLNTASVLHILNNDSDSDGSIDPSTVSILSIPENVNLERQASGQILIRPSAGFLGKVDFRYIVSDNEGRPSKTADVTVLIVVSTFQNPRNHNDVDDDLSVSPLDVLSIINLLNARGPSIHVDVLSGSPPYVDVNGDNMVDPLDVLQVINFINSNGALGEKGGEGESPSINAWPANEMIGKSSHAARGDRLDWTNAGAPSNPIGDEGEYWQTLTGPSRIYPAWFSVRNHVKPKVEAHGSKRFEETALIDRVFEEVWGS